jgi:hypothetical protein
MTTVKDLLELALADGHAPDPGQRVDPGGDVLAGRRLLRRRRLAGAGGAAAAVVVGVLVPLTIHGGGQVTTGTAPVRPPVTTVPVTPGTRSIALVAYLGEQPPGYRVAEMPSGWIVQGGGAFALVIAPKADTDTNPDSYTGKLVVMLQSSDAGVPTAGVSQPVDGRPGRLDVQGDTQMLTFQRADGRWVVIQAPTSLGWDGSMLAQFASGVQVLDNARPSRG